VSDEPPRIRRSRLRSSAVPVLVPPTITSVTAVTTMTTDRLGETDSGVDGDASDDRVSDKSITEGSLIRPLFHLAWPIVVIQLLQVMYNVVDTLYRATVGRGGRRDQPRVPPDLSTHCSCRWLHDRGRDPSRSTPAPTGTGPQGSSPARLSSASPYSRYHRDRRVLLHAPGARDSPERPRHGRRR